MWQDLVNELDEQEAVAKKPKTRVRLSNIKVHRISLVDKPANGETFVITKRAPETPEAALVAHLGAMTDEQVDSFVARLDDDECGLVYKVLAD